MFHVAIDSRYRFALVALHSVMVLIAFPGIPTVIAIVLTAIDTARIAGGSFPAVAEGRLV